MEQDVGQTGRTYELGLVTFQTDEEQANLFAQELSTERELEDDVYVVLYCRWAAAMVGGNTVIAAVRTREGELDQWVDDMTAKYQRKYGVSKINCTVDQYYMAGRLAAAGWNGGP